MGIKVMLVGVRLAFAHQLFTPAAFEEGKQPKFGCDLLLVPGSKVFKILPDKTKQETTMQAVLLEVANETWKGKGKEMLATIENSKKCLRDGNLRVTKTGNQYEGYEDLWYVAAKNKTRPTLLDRDKTPLTEADGKPYSGCYAIATIEVYGMPDPKKKGVHAALKGVQFVKDGDAFGGGSTPASPDEFEDLGVPETADDLI